MKHKGIFILIVALLVPAVIGAQETPRFSLSWDRISDPTVSTVLIYRSLPDNAYSFELIDSVSSSYTSYVDTDVRYNSWYFYRLRARSYTGSVGPFSDVVSGIMLNSECGEELKILCQIVATTKIDSVTFRFEWSTASRTTGKLRYWKEGESVFEETDESETFTSTHTAVLSGLEYNTSYKVCAVGHDEDGNLLVSPPVSIATVADTSSEGEDDGGEDADENPDETDELNASVPRVFPVPFNPDEGQLHFANMPEAGTFTIYDLSGRRVYKRSWSGTTGLLWDGRNEWDTIVSSGRYYIVIKDADGEVIDKRAILVVR